MTVTVWKIQVDNWGSDERFLNTMSVDEQHRAMEFRFDHDRLRYRCAHIALRRILARATGIPPGDLFFFREPLGRPRLARQAGMPDIRFNLTTCDRLALVAMTEGVDIGVDVERLRTPQNYLDIAKAQFSPRECDELVACPESGRVRYFCDRWVEREAAGKALGCGLAHLPPGQRGGIRDVRQLDVDPDYAAAVAVAGDEPVDAIVQVFSVQNRSEFEWA